MLESLPLHLCERSRILKNQSADIQPTDGGFVLYWMRTAVRTDENPAMDVAKHLANQQDVPLLIYHAISENYKYASDRHHVFMLQGARDVQTQLTSQGLSYAFHLATPNDRAPHLKTLASQASVIVTEDMPVDPPRRFLNTVVNSTDTPIVCVDTACVVPMQMIKKPYTRAFKFRSATSKLYAQRITRAWPSVDQAPQPFDLALLPFEPLNLADADLNELVSRCEIDHSIGPVVETVGGSAAGYQRWNHFKAKQLIRYAKQRNNALLDGVSRMSPYLHYGMVSPFRIARETAETDSAGSEKYLDELLIWRELAYAFCFYRHDHNQWSAIPEWAQETLAQHATDLRDPVYSWEQLVRGETGDSLWNAAQKSLLMQGELHNNVRMTWGKAILGWTRTPQDALATIIDLNHRYALDGRDPASYGGILWCLGQFDRPFQPEQSIIGSVRPRPSKQHAERLDVTKFLHRVATPRFASPPRVAVIGAGISGLIAARTLSDHGLDVTVFDKGRGVSGRMSTRRIDDDGTFDHGAQYFTARDPRFLRYVESWTEQGIVAKWPDQALGEDQKLVVLDNGNLKSESNSQNRFVAVPTMSAIGKRLASDLSLKTKTRITNIKAIDEGIKLLDATGNSLGKFDRLIVSAPAAQTVDLLVDFPDLAKQISPIQMNPCWATMVAFEKPLTDQWAGAFIHNSFLSWAARNSTKPGRDKRSEHLVIHAHPDWTAEHWDDDPDQVANLMLDEFWRATGIASVPNHHLQSHRWKFAIADQPSQSGYFSNVSGSIVACGDWANGSRVEGAFLSGMAAAGRILGTLSRSESRPDQQATLFE